MFINLLDNFGNIDGLHLTGILWFSVYLANTTVCAELSSYSSEGLLMTTIEDCSFIIILSEEHENQNETIAKYFYFLQIIAELLFNQLKVSLMSNFSSSMWNYLSSR